MAYLVEQEAGALLRRYQTADGGERVYTKGAGVTLVMLLRRPDRTMLRVRRSFPAAEAHRATQLLEHAKRLERYTRNSLGPLNPETIKEFDDLGLLTPRAFRELTGAQKFGPLTWDEACDKHLREIAKKDAPKWHRARTYLMRALVERIRGRWTTPAAVTVEEIEAYLAEREAAGLSPSTVNRDLFALRHLLQAAGLDTADGEQVPQRPKQSKARFPDALTWEEDLALLEAAYRSPLLRGQVFDAYLLLRLFGLRPSEAQYLTWDDVRDDRILVQPKKVAPHETHEALPDGWYRPKTKERRAVAPPHAAEVIALLRRRRDVTRSGRFVLGGERIFYDLVKAIRKALDAATPVEERTVKGVRVTRQRSRHSPYALRHTFATWMLNRQNSPQGFMHVKRWLGHANAATTELYTHLEGYREGSPTILEALRRLELPPAKVIPFRPAAAR